MDMLKEIMLWLLCNNRHGVGFSYLIENSHTIYGLRNSDSGPFRAHLVASTEQLLFETNIICKYFSL